MDEVDKIAAEMSADYIKRSDAIKAIFDKLIDGPYSSYTVNRFNAGLRTAMSVLKILPGEEVAPVVRCKDCKFWLRDHISVEGLARCQTGESGIRYRKAIDFCSRGKRIHLEVDND